MKNTEAKANFKRRKRITLMSSLMVLISYIVTQITTMAAKLLGLSSISYGQILILFGLSNCHKITFT